MKQTTFSSYPALVALAALFWVITPVIGAQPPTSPTPAPAAATPSDASLKWILPTPEMMGSQWVWPWEAPNNQAKISAESWKSQFWATQDPRPMLTKKWIDLEQTSEEVYQQQSAAYAQALQLPGARKLPLSRAQLIEELQTQTGAVTDFACVTYNQVRSNPGPASDADTDSLSLKLTSFSDAYLQERIAAFEMADGALASAFASARETRGMVHQAREEQTANLQKDYERALLDAYTFKKRLDEMQGNGLPPAIAANAGRKAKFKDEEARKAGIVLDQAIGDLGEVQGATLSGADGGFMVWSVEKSPETRSLRISGKLRHQNLVLEFGRSITGGFDKQGVLEDTVRILTMVSGRMARHLNRPGLEGTPLVLNLKPALQVAFTSQYTRAADPEALLNAGGELPAFIAATSRTPLEAAGPRKSDPGQQAQRYALIPPPPLPSTQESPALEELNKRAAQAYASNNLPEALTLYKRLAAARPGDPDVQLALGRTLNYLDDRAGAISAYTRVYELAPQTPYVRTWLAELHLARGERTRAVQWIGEELKANPGSAWAHSWLASTHLEIGDPTTAKAGFSTAAGLDPKVAGYRMQNGEALLSRNLHRRALTEFAAATYLDPANQEAYLGAAACYAALNERESAIQWYERYLQINPVGEGAAAARKALLKLSQSR